MSRKTETLSQHDRAFKKADHGSYQDPDGFQIRYYVIDEEDGEEQGGTLTFTRAEAESFAAFVQANPAKN